MASSAGCSSTDGDGNVGAASPRSGASSGLSAAAQLCGLDQDAAEAIKKSSLADEILKLREEQVKVRAERKRIQKELKNAQRRKRRLKGRARQLTNNDLLEVLLMRQSEKTEPSSQESGKLGDDDEMREKVPDGPEPDPEK